ncbi:MAG: AAA family ATPase [Acidobacteriota bacterium]|nr:MAG: AAA family ATPase [Acidobacteriota bacterium]
MYLEHWNLKEKPFDNTPDRRFLYPSENHRATLQKLLYALRGERGCAMLSGEYGCGKTVLVRTVIGGLNPDSTEIALINYPVFDRNSFLQDVLHQFGFATTATDARPELFRGLSQHFYDNINRGRRNVLIIDEAQIMDDPEVFEELRLMLNMQLEDRFLVSILLVGQPELREKIMLYPQLDQQIGVKCHLHRFDHVDTGHYIEHRLKVAGSASKIFTEEALYLVHKLSNGVPRRINNVADLCLLEGWKRSSKEVDGEIFKHIV